MAVNKNFVVKNGLEVNTNLIVGNAETKRVGIASTVPQYTLDVSGGIGATDLYLAGFTTIVKDLNVGASGTTFSVIDTFVGIGTDIPEYQVDIRSGVSVGQTALYIYGDAAITGDLNVTGDITYDEVVGRNLRITGLSTFVGVSTFKSDVYIDGNLNVVGDITYDEVVGRNLNITGLSTFVGISTFESDVYIAGDLNVIGDIVYDEVVGRNLYITGIGTIANFDVGNLNVTGLSTFVGFSTFNNDVYVAGVITATNYYGDGSNLVNAGTSLGMVIALGG